MKWIQTCFNNIHTPIDEFHTISQNHEKQQQQQQQLWSLRY